MTKVILIRHGQTHSNTLKRYLGRTNEPLLESSIEQLKEKHYPKIDILYTTPMKRCIQTAEVIYENMIAIQIEDLKECDFGDFEGKNYKELSNNKEYQKWMRTLQIKEFPNGEKLEEYQERTIQAMNKILDIHKGTNITIGLIVHGGTIMNIMKYLSKEQTNQYDWTVKNGCGYIITLDTLNKIEKTEEIT